MVGIRTAFRIHILYNISPLIYHDVDFSVASPLYID